MYYNMELLILFGYCILSVIIGSVVSCTGLIFSLLFIKGKKRQGFLNDCFKLLLSMV